MGDLGNFLSLVAPAVGRFSHRISRWTPCYTTQPRATRSILLAMDIRLLRPSDIPLVQQANITNLPENYFLKYYLYHALAWPQLSYVAVDVRAFCTDRDTTDKCVGIETSKDGV
jgi:hypothetical protein